MSFPLAGHTNCYHTYSFEEALDGIARAGFKGVEMSAVPGWTEHVSLDDAPAKVRTKLDERELSATSLSAHSDLTTDEGVDYAIKALAWAADFGLQVLNTAVGGHQSANENESAFLAHVGALAEAAALMKVVVALEIHGDIMASSDITLKLLERIGSEWVRVNYDTGNVEFYSGKKAVDDLPGIVPYLAHVHLKDTAGGKGNWNFPACGEGTVDFPRVIEILDTGGYRGPMSVEIEFRGDRPWPSLEEVNRSMRASYQHLSALGLS
ncbi:MAG: sugar phosphate isomerase/epimerase family protein [Acidimicrobiales bacterium]